MEFEEGKRLGDRCTEGEITGFHMHTHTHIHTHSSFRGITIHKTPPCLTLPSDQPLSSDFAESNPRRHPSVKKEDIGSIWTPAAGEDLCESEFCWFA